MNDYPEPTIDDLARMAGIRVYDTALMQSWVDHVWNYTKEVTGKNIYPTGFVWGYDDSTIFGEPIPLTEEARQLMKLISATTRNPKYMTNEWELPSHGRSL